MAMFQDEGAVECLVLLIILSVPVGVLWGYIASFAFRRPRSCLVLMPILSLLVGSPLDCNHCTLGFPLCADRQPV